MSPLLSGAIMGTGYVSVRVPSLISAARFCNCQLYIPSILKTICCVILLRRRYDYWLGVNVTLYPGVIIDDRVIVVAGSVVVHDVPSDVMVTGNPVVVKRHLK